ncbi:MAG TPA: helix-turn-helix domain-containing protein [Amycolatopsis sp.]|nr:helix-turn-helix domain-containing protein [Amycolatopsis sp.]
MSARTDEIFDRVVTTASTTVLAFDDDTVLEAFNKMCENNLRVFGELLGVPEARLSEHVPRQAAEMGCVYARRHASRESVVELHRHGTSVTYGVMLEELLRGCCNSDTLHEVLALSWHRLIEFVNASLDESVSAYDSENFYEQHSTNAHKASIVRQLLDGATSTDDMRAAGQSLDHDLGLVQTAMVLVLEQSSLAGNRLGVGARLIHRAASLLQSASVLVVATGPAEMSAWIGTSSAPDISRLFGLDTELRAQQSRLAVGGPASGLEGFRRSHREARWADRAARQQASPTRVTLHADVAAIALVTDPMQARAFIGAELGGLAADDDEARRLRRTVAVFCEAGFNITRAAELLNTHKNTVNYRLRKAERRRGVPLSVHRMELELALRLIGD